MGRNRIQELSVQIPTVPWTQEAPSNHYRFIFLDHPSSPPLFSQSLKFKCHLLFPTKMCTVSLFCTLTAPGATPTTEWNTCGLSNQTLSYSRVGIGFSFSLGSWQSACDLVHLITLLPERMFIIKLFLEPTLLPPPASNHRCTCSLTLPLGRCFCFLFL